MQCAFSAFSICGLLEGVFHNTAGHFYSVAFRGALISFALVAFTLIGIALVALGFYVDTLPVVYHYYLMPLGIPWKGFASSDYFPLLPYLGFFLLGSALGKSVYRNKQTLLPKVNDRNPIIRFLSGCGKLSLWIYLLHQPILSGIFFLITEVLS